MRNVVCTIVAKNYFAAAMALRSTVRQFEPGVEFVVLLADSDEQDNSGTFGGEAVLEAHRLGIPNFLELAFKYDVTEFCTCLKPFLISHLFDVGYDKVVYLDPDISLFTSLAEVFQLLETKSVVLTPHILDPKLLQARKESDLAVELSLMESGSFNLGFVAFASGTDSRRLLEWWAERLSLACFVDRKSSLYTDQKWVDMFPSLSDSVGILRNPGLNVAWWNFAERDVTVEDGRWVVKTRSGTTPIVFFHFSGFRPGDLSTISKLPQTTYSRSRASLEAIFSTYSSLVETFGHQRYRVIPYGYSRFENGSPILPLHRRLVRALADEGKTVQNPFGTGKGSFYDSLATNGLLVKSRNREAKVALVSYSAEGKNRVEEFFQLMFRFVFGLVGVERYSYLIRFFSSRVSLDRQLHLLKKVGSGWLQK